jgi:hypothetical protein
LPSNLVRCSSSEEGELCRQRTTIAVSYTFSEERMISFNFTNTIVRETQSIRIAIIEAFLSAKIDAKTTP